MRKSKYNMTRKVYNGHIKRILLTFIAALFLWFVIYMYYSSPHSVKNDHHHKGYKKLQHQQLSFKGKKYVHLDLKGAPPKVSYFNYLIPLLAKVGVDGLVIEYEDMFPYESELLKNISALNSYSKENITYINDLATLNGLEVIPLIQTFGHLEFVLKLPQFVSLREVPKFPQVLCPTNEDALKLVTNMVSEIINAHPHIKMIHIGADETKHLGRCDRCFKKMQQNKMTKEQLYLSHVAYVCDFIKKKYPSVSILIWDDVMRNIPDEELEGRISNLDITPVIWQYTTDVGERLTTSLWQQYSKYFDKVWIASAFKGAAGVDRYLVDGVLYSGNHRSWLEVYNQYQKLINIEAIILTGWQRYDHFSILCELLPVAIPSLLINLNILQMGDTYNFGPPTQAANILKCEQPYALMGAKFGTPTCSYPGSDILEHVYRLHFLKEDLEQLKTKSQIRGWMTEFNAFHNFSSPDHILKFSAELDHLEKEVKEIEKDMSIALLEVYDVYTKDEWIFTYVKPIKEEILRLFEIKNNLLEKTVWPRRPLMF